MKRGETLDYERVRVAARLSQCRGGNRSRARRWSVDASASVDVEVYSTEQWVLSEMIGETAGTEGVCEGFKGWGTVNASSVTIQLEDSQMADGGLKADLTENCVPPVACGKKSEKEAL